MGPTVPSWRDAVTTTCDSGAGFWPGVLLGAAVTAFVVGLGFAVVQIVLTKRWLKKNRSKA